MNKKCPKCDIIKITNEFHKDKSRCDGLSYKCKSCISEKQKLYYKNNKEKVIKYHNESEVIKIYRKSYEYKMSRKNSYNKRLKTDSVFKMLCYLRSRIYNTLKGNNKSAKTKELVGCSIKELKFYLESGFVEGMNWDNYGEWHIDHVIPCSSFDLSKPEEQRRCFNYTNLQPLWAMDNYKKHNRLDWGKNERNT